MTVNVKEEKEKLAIAVKTAIVENKKYGRGTTITVSDAESSYLQQILSEWIYSQDKAV